MDFIDALMLYLPESCLVWLTAAVALCAALATVLPIPREGARLYAALYRLVQLVALNRARAKNAQDADVQTKTEKDDEEKL